MASLFVELAIVAEQVVVAGAGPVVVAVDEGRKALIVHRVHWVVGLPGGLGNWQKLRDRKAHAGVEVAAVVVVVRVDLVDSLLKSFRFAPCSCLIGFGHMQEQQQSSCPLPP